MYRTIPIGNKLCAKRNEQRHNERHRRMIREMKPSIDTREPSTMRLEHLRTNLKREQLLEDRYTEIDRENRILLQKMSDIMRKPLYRFRSDVGGPVSLNKDARKKELIRITEDNQAILRRIQRTEPVYNHLQWEEGHRRNELYLRNACEYPVVLRRGDRHNMSAPDLLSPSSHEPQQDTLERLLQEDAEKKKEPEEADLKFVLKEGKKIGESYYLVEMATDGRTLTISAYDGDAQQTLELLINEKNHRRLHRECGGDYSALASRLAVDGDRLHIVAVDEQPSMLSGPSASSPQPILAQSASAPSFESRENVNVDIGSSGVNINVRGLTPSTVSLASGYA